MNSHRLMLASALLCGVASAAHATRNPTPPPSGIVVHLFGPGSVMSNIAPGLPGETAGPATAPAATAPGGDPTAPPIAAPAAQAGDAGEPTLGAVLHQMFVVGDPDHPNQPSAGRVADRPPTGD